MKKSGLFLLFVTLSLLFYSSLGGNKQLSEELKSKANLPINDKNISLIVEKNATNAQLNVDNNEQNNFVYYSITNLGKRIIKPQVVVNGKDWFTDKSIVEYALKDIKDNNPTNEEKAIALFKFIVNTRYHWSPPLYGISLYYIENPVRYLNNWGYGFCSNSSTVLVSLISLAGFESRLVNLVDHIVSEVYYDESWHVFDPDMAVYYRNFQGGIASVEEIINNPQLLDSPILLRNIDNYVTKNQIRTLHAKAYSKPVQIYTPAETMMKNKEYQNELIYRLRPSEEIRFYYNFKGQYYWGYRDPQPPEYTNGVLISDNNGGFIQFKLPYPILSSYVYKPGLCQALHKSRISLNGLNWKKITDCQDDILSLTKLFPIGKGSHPTENFFLVLPFSLTEYQILVQFQTAPNSIPRLNTGNNDIELRQSLNSDIKLEFGYEQVY